MNQLGNVNAYTDISRFSAMRAHAQRDQRAAFSKIAKEFEALFVEMMLKTAREASPEGGLFDSGELKIYQEMFDSQVALTMADRGALGFERALRDQLGFATAGPKAQDQHHDALSLPPRRADLSAPSLPGNTGFSNPGKAEVPAVAPPAVTAASPGAAGPDAIGEDKGRGAYDFVNTLYPHALKAARRLNTTPGVIIAQAALETGWGQHLIKRADGTPSHNYFAIKANRAWPGDRANVRTLEFFDGKPIRVNAAFRAYEDIGAAFDDYVDLIRGNDRYQSVLQSGGDPDRYAHAIADAGYATDPSYAEKIIAIERRVEALTAHADAGGTSIDLTEIF